MCEKTSLLYNASANSTCAHPPSSWATAGHLPALLVRGWGISKFCMAQGWTFVTPRLLTRTWFVVVVPFQCIQLNLTWRILLETQADWLINQGQKNFLRFLKACFLNFIIHAFPHCLSIYNLWSEIGSYQVNRHICLWWPLLNQISVDLGFE